MRALGLLLLAPALATAQALEPRAYSNLPVGLNFAIAAYSYSTGGIAFDPSIPLEDGEGRIDALGLVYVRTLDVLGNAGNLAVVLPVAHFSGSAALNGVQQDRAMTGLGDPTLRLAVNFHGAPALTTAQFASYKQDLIVGASLMLTAPLGQYDSDHVINLGTNRWSAKPEIGLSQAVGPWTFELSAAGTWYTKNDDFFGGTTREQDPIYSTQLHVTRQFGRGMWGAVSGTWYAGGRTSVDGVPRDDRQSGSRFGATFAFPLGGAHSLKLFASTGLYTRTGQNFDTFGVAWQTFWGGR